MTEESNSGTTIDHLSDQEKRYLLGLAREALVLGVRGVPLPDLEMHSIAPKLGQPGATFVTLTKNKESTRMYWFAGSHQTLSGRCAYTYCRSCP